jgi:catechol 2,3-dioxygenase-like lactoylglutathione lyase family enzyme
MIRIAKGAIDIGVVVANLRQQRHFYGEVLGFPYAGSMPVPNGTVHVYLCGESYLKLYAMDGTPSSEPTPFGSKPGFAYITFTVTDVRAAFHEALEKGATALAEPGTFDGGTTLVDPIGRMQARFALLADADGNMIELFEYCDLSIA